MNEEDLWRPRCAYCGRFVSYSADYEISFGGSYDTEPPEAGYICPQCIEKQKEFYRARGKMPSAWQPAEWHVELANEMGYTWQRQKGNGWGEWVKGDAAEQLEEQNE